MSIVVILGMWFASSIVGGILIGRFIARTQAPCPPAGNTAASAPRRSSFPIHTSPHKD